MSSRTQPLLHDETPVLCAPMQIWSNDAGVLGDSELHGIYVSDLRVVSRQEVLLDGHAPETIADIPFGSDRRMFVSLLRAHDRSPDPDVRVEHLRQAVPDGVRERIEIRSRLPEDIQVVVNVTIEPDNSELDHVKAGLPGLREKPEVTLDGTDVRWNASDGISAALSATDATIDVSDGRITLSWRLRVPGSGSASVGWRIDTTDIAPVLVGDRSDIPWSAPDFRGDDRLERWVAQSLVDLASLRMAAASRPDLGFIAAGAPWFFTLFGRDSIWAARFMLPLGTELAATTLQLLASLQGTKNTASTAEQPGKILHELRRGPVQLDAGRHLPPLYFGTVDATPLWVCLLHDAWRAGLDDREVEPLLPHLRAALEWMRTFGDPDGDGLLEYIDGAGEGLANQGWKDSGDSVQWNDGSLAEGPIALCEVQGYAYEAALGGAAILDHFGENGSPWRGWAVTLKRNFNERFWVRDNIGLYPAIALDAEKNPVDSLTSNIGHLLGTGILDHREEELVAARLVSPELNSGFGLRTMSTNAAGYWPLSYHGGSVWTHDTAIAVIGLEKAGFHAEAMTLVEGLLSAAASFDYQMPELYSGDDATQFSRPVPYPAACRPQAWAAAASVAVMSSVKRIRDSAE